MSAIAVSPPGRLLAPLYVDDQRGGSESPDVANRIDFYTRQK
jgi:hypothetical protein